MAKNTDFTVADLIEALGKIEDQKSVLSVDMKLDSMVLSGTVSGIEDTTIKTKGVKLTTV